MCSTKLNNNDLVWGKWEKVSDALSASKTVITVTSTFDQPWKNLKAQNIKRNRNCSHNDSLLGRTSNTIQLTSAQCTVLLKLIITCTYKMLTHSGFQLGQEYKTMEKTSQNDEKFLQVLVALHSFCVRKFVSSKYLFSTLAPKCCAKIFYLNAKLDNRFIYRLDAYMLINTSTHL